MRTVRCFHFIVLELKIEHNLENAQVPLSHNSLFVLCTEFSSSVCKAKNDHSRTDLNGTWWSIGRLIAFRPKGGGFISCSSRHVEGSSIRAVSGAPLSSSGLEKAL